MRPQDWGSHTEADAGKFETSHTDKPSPCVSPYTGDEFDPDLERDL